MVQYTVGHLLHAKFGPDQGREVGTGASELENLFKITLFGFCHEVATVYTN